MSSTKTTNFGAADNPFRLLLFADQSLEQLVTVHSLWPQLEEGDSWQLVRQAYQLERQGQSDSARNLLDRVLKMEGIETRAALWTWAALRGVGVIPHNGNHHRVRGVVLEMPMHAGIDTVAVYEDGSGCYINYTGQSPILWDAADGPIGEAISQILSVVQPLTAEMFPVYTHPVPARTEVQVTALTYGGSLRATINVADFIEGVSPFSPLYAAGGDVVAAIVERVWRDKQQEE